MLWEKKSSQAYIATEQTEEKKENDDHDQSSLNSFLKKKLTSAHINTTTKYTPCA